MLTPGIIDEDVTSYIPDLENVIFHGKINITKTERLLTGSF